MFAFTLLRNLKLLIFRLFGNSWLMILLAPLSLGLALTHNSLINKKIEAAKAFLASSVHTGVEYKTPNTQLVQDILSVLASRKIANLWIEEMSFEDQKCTISLKMRSLLVNNIYQYVSSIMDSDLFKKSKADIVYSTITKKGFKSSGIADNKDSEDASKVAPEPFILAYVRQQNALRNIDAEPTKSTKKTNSLNKVADEYNYELTIKMSLCN